MRNDDKKRAIFIGAGPYGLTAASELLIGAGMTPIVLEKSQNRLCQINDQCTALIVIRANSSGR